MANCSKCGFLKLIITYVGQCLAKNQLIWKKKLNDDTWCEDYMPRIEWMLPEEHKKYRKDLKKIENIKEKVDILDLETLEKNLKKTKKVYKLPFFGKVSGIKTIEGFLKFILLIVVCVLVGIIIYATL
ncbi:MAG: hypothetical protein QMD92_00765 [bacterium]|nr:hypothetical protein [bacterium]